MGKPAGVLALRIRPAIPSLTLVMLPVCKHPPLVYNDKGMPVPGRVTGAEAEALVAAVVLVGILPVMLYVRRLDGPHAL